MRNGFNRIQITPKAKRKKIFYLVFVIIFFLVTAFSLIRSFIIINNRKAGTAVQVSHESLQKQLNSLHDEAIRSKPADKFSLSRNFPISLTPKYTADLGLSSSAYGVMDRDSRELLLAKNLNVRMSIASLTKVMTAVVSLEQIPLDRTITVSSSAATIGEASMGLSAGERLTVSDLLYGMVLPSGNDAAEALAEEVGQLSIGSVSQNAGQELGRLKFLVLLNEKARALGMNDTYLYNPSGLDEESKETSNFSTALDLLGLASYALDNPTFAKIADTRELIIPYKKGFHKAFYLENILQFSDSFAGIKGIKPGNSIFAKETLISYAEHDGRRIIAVLLGSDYTKNDVLKIYHALFP